MNEWTEKDVKEIKEWQEKDHPRGQPDNAGQFASKTNEEKMRDAIKKYSDTPEKDMKKMGIENKQSFSNFIERVKSGKAKPGETFVLGEITDRARKDIERLTEQKLNATKHALSVDEVKHIEKGHGEQGKSDHSMASVDDYKRMANVLSDYDNVDFARNNKGEIDTTHAYLDKNGSPSKLIKFTKKYPDNEQFVVEAVNDTKGKLHIISGYKKATNSK